MPSVNGHGHKQAILYTRVSGHRQRDHGYSLSDQKRELEEWAAKEGYDVLEVVEDGAWSGGDLVRPGLDRARDLVASGSVDAVVTLFRDRLARGVYAGLLAQEFAEHGCRLIALNAQVDDSPEGELHGGMLDIVANWERKKTAERTRRGKLEKARQGKIVANNTVSYGFKYNKARDGYLVDEETMPTVRRIFRMIGVEGKTVHAVKVALEREHLPSPGGKRYWNETFIRSCVLDDVYRPHAHEEIEALVTPDVAAQLDPSKSYGIWWYGKNRSHTKQVAVEGPNGKRYKRQNRYTPKPKKEWIGVPVPDSGVSRELVDAAREAIKNNRPISSAGQRFWELSGGILHCAGCGRRMQTHAVTGGEYKNRYFYYVCSTVMDHGKTACWQKSIRADKLEPRVWEFVSGMLKDPEQLRADLERMIELEREGARRDPEREAKAWAEKLADIERKREGYWDLAASGDMPKDVMRAKVAELEDQYRTAERELEVLRSKQERLEELERDKDIVLESYAGTAPEALDALTPEDRHQLYRILRLSVTQHADGTLELRGAFCDDPTFLFSETVSRSRSIVTSRSGSYPLIS